jgi:hypothetical protein
LDDEAEFDDDLTVLPATTVSACAAAFAEVSAEAIAEEESTLAERGGICDLPEIRNHRRLVCLGWVGGFIYEALRINHS